MRDWVLDTYPWKNSPDLKNLNTVTREDVGFIQGKHYVFVYHIRENFGGENFRKGLVYENKFL